MAKRKTTKKAPPPQGGKPATKADLVKELAEALDWPQADAEKALNAVWVQASQHLAKNGAYQAHGFGSFKAKAMPKRKGRNPRTGEAITVPASVSARWAPSSVLRRLLNG